jgi:hypothetical protein
VFCVPKCVVGLENRPDVVAVPNPLELTDYSLLKNDFAPRS